jgi:cytoskeletal protein RodZ
MTITLGEFLQKTREEKGLNLAEVAYQTKIREHYLYALENNQVEKMPSKMQGKGYLRIYAQFLGLDEKMILTAWDHPEKLIIEQKTVETITEISPKSDLTEKILEEKEEENIISEEGTSEEEKIYHGSEDNLKEITKNEKEGLSLSQQIFVSIGEKLKAQRQQLNLSTLDIEQFTSIRPYYLEALENGTIEKLPSIPQARGMLNNYANFLNLDVDKIMNEFAEGLQTRRNESYAPHKIGSDNQLAYQSPEIKKVGWLKFITADILLTSGLIIALFIFILWGAANISGFQDKNEQVEPPSISDILLENTPEIQETELSAEVFFDPSPTLLANAGEETSEEMSETEIGPQLSGLPVQVYIIARQRAYLKVDVDGETVFTGRTVPGNAYEYSGSTSVEILTGNAAALEIFYNLVPVGVIGDIGEVKSLVFTTSTGIITPTPMFSPSSTITLQPSPTLQPSATPTSTPTITPTVTPLIP